MFYYVYTHIYIYICVLYKRCNVQQIVGMFRNSGILLTYAVSLPPPPPPPPLVSGKIGLVSDNFYENILVDSQTLIEYTLLVILLPEDVMSN